MESSDQVERIEQFKMKRLIKKLENARGAGTSMISIILRPKNHIADITRQLTEEYSKAANIKDRVNRNSVQSAMLSAKERLKLYNNKTPNNGLVLFCGQILEEDGRTEKKIMIDFEPFKPVSSSLYMCDHRFHPDELKCLLENEDPFGFIVVDGNGALFATLQGNFKNVITKFGVELPKKHGRGGQSSQRFARIRLEKRHHYLKKVCETTTNVFISNNMPNVQGLVLAGSADFKNDLNTSQFFDPRLAKIVVKVVDVQYGGENGLNQAIEISSESLSNVKFVKEKQLVSNFFEQIAQETGKYVYGVSDTMKSLESGALETILCFENLEHIRVTLKNKQTDAMSVAYLKPEELSNPKYYKDEETSAELESVEQQNLTEWLAENYQNFGSSLEFITDKSPEGFQFVKGFTGMGGFLRYKFDVENLNVGIIEEEDEDDFI